MLCALERLCGSLRPRVPFRCLVGSPEFLEHDRIRVEQRGAVRVRGVRVELRDLQFAECGIRLPLIESRARHGDREFDLHCRGQRTTIHRAREFERTIGTAEAAFAVDHHRQLVIAPGDAAVGAQFAQREAEVTGRVGGDRERLAYHADAAGTACRRDRVLVRQLGVLVDESGHHHQVTGDPLGVVGAEGLQLVAGNAVEFLRLRVVGQLWIRVRSPHRPRVELVLEPRLTITPAALTVPACTLAVPAAILALPRALLAPAVALPGTLLAPVIPLPRTALAAVIALALTPVLAGPSATCATVVALPGPLVNAVEPATLATITAITAIATFTADAALTVAPTTLIALEPSAVAPCAVTAITAIPAEMSAIAARLVPTRTPRCKAAVTLATRSIPIKATTPTGIAAPEITTTSVRTTGPTTVGLTTAKLATAGLRTLPEATTLLIASAVSTTATVTRWTRAAIAERTITATAATLAVAVRAVTATTPAVTLSERTVAATPTVAAVRALTAASGSVTRAERTIAAAVAPLTITERTFPATTLPFIPTLPVIPTVWPIRTRTLTIPGAEWAPGRI